MHSIHIGQDTHQLWARKTLYNVQRSMNEMYTCGRLSHAALFRTLASKPELALDECIYEGPGFKEYLQRDTRGQQAAQLRFQLRSGTSMLRHHDSPAMTQRTASAQLAVSRVA